MKPVVLGLSLLLGLTGCVVRTVSVPPPPPAPPVVVAPTPVPRVHYFGEHTLPGGDWCYVDGPHEHDFYPQVGESYVYDGTYYYWRAPVVITYYAGHPVPGGGWCTLAGPHRHEYVPPRDTYWVHVAGRGYVY